jgi:hypothetical protein
VYSTSQSYCYIGPPKRESLLLGYAAKGSCKRSADEVDQNIIEI